MHTKSVMIRRYKGGSFEDTSDLLAVEEPLEIRLEYGPLKQRKSKNISITMRTPGADEDLAVGFLFTEGIVRRATDVFSVKGWDENLVMVSLQPDFHFDLQKLERHFYTSSSCGVCGKGSLEAVKTTVSQECLLAGMPWSIQPEVIYSLPEKLRREQETFDVTGGLHACALFDREGNLLVLREDVGRHNALDKLIGHYLRKDQIPLNDHILMLSGRASFELLQKAAMAGIRCVCAVGAPSSLAVETAAEFGITLVGFLREGRFNVYSGS
ncbi:MAG: formate dehydrogenase accessory sulfurtransferase FdhD [Saprospiraceae bacterium]|nr:formate dehydrogenase accessory sulfurtransferase FdhD [Saprospiraceae bacterium]